MATGLLPDPAGLLSAGLLWLAELLTPAGLLNPTVLLCRALLLLTVRLTLLAAPLWLALTRSLGRCFDTRLVSERFLRSVLLVWFLCHG